MHAAYQLYLFVINGVVYWQICVETMMHLTCTNMPQDKLSQALDKVSSVAMSCVVHLLQGFVWPFARLERR